MPVEMRLNYDSGVPVYRQIIEGVVTALGSGELGPSEQLPTIHDLARRLDINPNTVIRAYRELEHGGYIVSQRGKGTFPSSDAPKPPSRKLVLAQICKRAIEEAVRHGIEPGELIEQLKRELK